MASVPWIKISTSFFTHRKTIKLRALLGDSEPIQRLWAWAAQCADSGDLSGISFKEIEDAIGWRGEPGKAFKAFVECGFLDVDGLTVLIHGWEEHTGGGVKRLLHKRDKQRDFMREKRKKGNVGDDVDSDVSVDKGSNIAPNERETSSLLSSSLRDHILDPDQEQEPCQTTLPVNADRMIHCMRVAIQRENPERGLWNDGGTFAATEARGFLEGFGASPPGEEIQRRIDLFAKDKDMAPWTVKKFVSEYNRIGLAKVGKVKGGIDPSVRGNW